MKRSAKRVVGWSVGIALGIILALLAFVLILALNTAPSGVEDGQQIVKKTNAAINTAHGSSH